MNVLIREATLKDREWIRDCALQHAPVFYPRLRPDREKIDALVTDCISSPAHYARVIECDGKIRGCLLAFVNPMQWAERQVARIMLWVSYIPMAGVRALREFRDWVLTRRGIKIAGMAPDFDWPDERVGHLIERIGFCKTGANYMYYN